MLKFRWLATEEKRNIVSVVNSLPDPVFIMDRQGRYLDVLGGTERSLYDNPGYLKGKTLYEVLPEASADHYLSMIHSALDTGTIQVVEYSLMPDTLKNNPGDGPRHLQWFQGRISPLHTGEGPPELILWTVINITEKKQVELERDRAMADLEKALAEIRTLKGILPICSACKKIRDEQGEWHPLETYISHNSEADFTHGICPECKHKLYPECCRDTPGNM
ncbi:PAS domain-containing protein [Desulfoluna spongiiphila]|uniref:PAS fold-containing protein n=1 Tax=Desulfoluna spongiiphila TaxID=419481 RepID=A0A1G5FE69_9BACT|nr:PAS domain-containing protein [Desulfoluna spongiiphila]SCY37454.1 PAS fold-containing protein [Desulfoluna spongiiphila]VVS95650.1 pas fold-4 [Desulfoluna spongiiphila]